MFKQKFISSVLMLVFAVFGFSTYSRTAFAAAGDIQVTVNDELGVAVSGATVSILCTGGSYTALTGTTDGSGVISAAPQAGSSCNDTDTLSIQVTKAGVFIPKTVTSVGTYVAASNPNIFSVGGVQYPLKIVVNDELGNSMAPLSNGPIPTFNGNGPTYTTNTAYWNITNASAGTLVLTRDGYVNATTTNPGMTITTNPNTQVVVTFSGQGSPCTGDISVSTTCRGLQYASKITSITNEIGTALTSGLTVATGNSFGTGCSLSGGAWYCATPAADTGIAVSVAKDGYVTNTATSFASDRTSGSDAQQTVAVTGILYAYKVSSITDEIGAVSTSGLVVTTGNSFGTTCTLNGSSWYCAVPLANTGIIISAAKDGYVTNTATSFTADRTVATDAQQTQTVSMQHALAISVVNNQGVAISGLTVVAGDNLGVSCIESSSRVYYCILPLATTGTTASVLVSPTYPAMSGSYTLRTLATDAPVVVVIPVPQTTTTSGGSGGGYMSPVAISVSNTIPTVSASTTTVVFAAPKFTQISVNVNAKSDMALIKNLQAVLNNALGNNLEVALTIDGKWGNKTVKAIKMFQKSAGVKVTGTINTSTRTKLNATIK